MIKNWETKTLGEICNFVGGGTPSKNNPDYWNGDIPWASIKDIKGQYLNKTSDHITDKGLKESATNLAYPNEIILATRINPGRPIISKMRTSINQDLKIVRPKIEVDNSFLYYLFLNIENEIIKLSNGTTVLGITLNSLNDIDIQLPSLETQKAIVSKIEELFSELDKGIEDLKTAQQQLQVYRLSVLKDSFEKKALKIPNFKYCKIGDIVDMQSGLAFKKSEYSKDGVKLFQIANVSFNYTKWDNIEYLPMSYIEKYKDLLLSDGDIVMALNRPLLNDNLKIAEIKQNDIPAILYQRVGRFKFLNNDYPKYFLYFLQSPNFIKWLKDQLQGVNIPFINKSKLLNYNLFPQCSVEDKKNIVQEIESRLSVADKMEESISQSIQQAEALRQSILKKAFSGELV